MVPIQKQKVVIIGHGSTSRLSLVRAVAELGCDITVIVMSWFYPFTRKINKIKPFDCYSKYISHVYYCPAADGDGLIQLLLSKCTAAEQKVIIIPSSDFSAATIDDNKSRLSEYFLFPSIKTHSRSVRYWMDKERQKDLAREIGLQVPAARIVEIQDRTYEIPEGITYPCFTKALVTLVGGKQCFNRCNDQDELCKALNVIGAKQDATILIEDFKDIEAEYAVL